MKLWRLGLKESFGRLQRDTDCLKRVLAGLLIGRTRQSKAMPGRGKPPTAHRECEVRRLEWRERC